MSDFAAEYGAATQGLAMFDMSHRTRLLVRGRAPGQMLKGVLTGVMPPAPRELDHGVWAGRATYHAVLTPKGKMISDLWATLLGDESEAGYLLDVPAEGRASLLESFAKLLPPRFAAVEDATERTGMIALVGPEAAPALSESALAGHVTPAEASGLEEGEWRCVGPPAGSLLAERTREVWPEAYAIVGPGDAIDALASDLVHAGAISAGDDVWSTLRVEAGRPAFGTDMDEETLPPEAGIDNRAIDHSKGCYTGQEVIVRIRDRGHVNRKLRVLELGEAAPPPRGAELLAADGSGKAVGWITSAVRSPKHGGVVALGYVARGHEGVLLDGREIAVGT